MIINRPSHRQKLLACTVSTQREPPVHSFACYGASPTEQAGQHSKPAVYNFTLPMLLYLTSPPPFVGEVQCQTGVL